MSRNRWLTVTRPVIAVLAAVVFAAVVVNYAVTGNTVGVVVPVIAVLAAVFAAVVFAAVVVNYAVTGNTVGAVMPVIAVLFAVLAGSVGRSGTVLATRRCVAGSMAVTAMA